MECRSPAVTWGYGIGLLDAWAVLWSATLIIFCDARGELRRIEEAEVTYAKDRKDLDPEQKDATGAVTGAEPHENDSVQKRSSTKNANQATSTSTRSRMATTFAYQSLPTTFLHRLDWALDLVSNFRGVRWTHAISTVPPPPLHISNHLLDPVPKPPNQESYLTRRDLLRQTIPRFIFCVFALDVLKTLTMHDPYFLSFGPSTPSPFPYPRTTRTALSLLFAYTALKSIFLLAPLTFAIILGPEQIGAHAWPWLYAPYFGPASQVFDHGIAGLWGGWWHGLFRFAFEQAGDSAEQAVGWGRKEERGMLLRVMVAFGCSAALHACASYTSLGPSKPLMGSALFFLFQPVGIIGQRAFTGWMRKKGWRERMPVSVRRVGNLAVVVAWCALTGPLVADDFAATGIWLFEPVPISLFRGLSEEGWWRWSGSWVRWHTGNRWWKSGLAF
ncbi:hypothetical protein MMC21_003337 [Puttea exsequens]|nr:hypothetical protein [Puttea exsequens]